MHAWAISGRNISSEAGRICRKFSQNRATFPLEVFLLCMKSHTVRSTAWVKWGVLSTTLSQMFKSTFKSLVAVWASAGAMEVSDLLHRMGILHVQCASLSSRRRWVATAEVATEMTLLFLTCRTPCMALVANVLFVPPRASSKNRRERFWKEVELNRRWRRSGNGVWRRGWAFTCWRSELMAIVSRGREGANCAGRGYTGNKRTKKLQWRLFAVLVQAWDGGMYFMAKLLQVHFFLVLGC